MSGTEIKKMLKQKRLYIYEVAEEIGITEFTLHRWLRHDLTDEQREKVMTAISSLEKARASQ